jgi:autophagy-related protein 5
MWKEALPLSRLGVTTLTEISTMSTYGTTRHHHSPAAQNYSNRDRVTDYHTTLFRRLTWDGTVPLEIRIDPKELPANSERGLECYYIQAPRVSYLPLIMPEIRRFFNELVFDETAAAELKEEEWWFETAEGSLLKWLVLCVCSYSVILMCCIPGIGQ